MYLRATKPKNDGKEHRHWSVVEAIRLPDGSGHQKTLLDLVSGRHSKKPKQTLVSVALWLGEC